jgi:signal transduction histidine kinase
MHADALHLLNDELGSLLVAVKMDVDWLDQCLSEQEARDANGARALRERMRSKCQDMSRLLESAVGNVGRIVTDLRPGIMGHQSLWAALERQAQEFVQAAKLELEWDLQAADPPELAGTAALAVFRIFQEMLDNVGRHAQASRLSVRIAADLERLRITVEDNGNGASPEAFEAAGAHGVTGMRERARHLGGHIAIASEVGHGSAFTLVLPLAGPAAHFGASRADLVQRNPT